MENDANKSMKFLFGAMSIALVVLSFRVKIIYRPGVDSVMALWYTFLYIFGVMPVFGVMTIFLHLLKDYLYTRKDKVFNFFDHITDRVTGAALFIGGGICGNITLMLLFEPTWKGVIISWAVMFGGFVFAMLYAACKKFAEKFGEDSYDTSKKQYLKYKSKQDEKAKGKKARDEKRA